MSKGHAATALYFRAGLTSAYDEDASQDLRKGGIVLGSTLAQNFRGFDEAERGSLGHGFAVRLWLLELACTHQRT